MQTVKTVISLHIVQADHSLHSLHRSYGTMLHAAVIETHKSYCFCKWGSLLKTFSQQVSKSLPYVFLFIPDEKDNDYIKSGGESLLALDKVDLC